MSQLVHSRKYDSNSLIDCLQPILDLLSNCRLLIVVEKVDTKDANIHSEMLVKVGPKIVWVFVYHAGVNPVENVGCNAR